MNTKIVIVVLAVAVAGLGISLFVVKNQDDQRHAADVTTSLNLSNDLNNANADLQGAKQVNITLTNDLMQARQQGIDISNSLTAAVAATRDQLAQETQSAQAAEAASKEKISGLNKRVSDLEADNNALDQRAAELTNTIAQLTGQIKDIQGQLADTRTDKAYLEKQLEQLREQKADLEHKFNDLNTVRNQYKKLKTEAFIDNRIQLDRATAATAGKKGGEILIQHSRTMGNNGAARPAHYDLNVEVGSDGSVHVISPAVTSTNAGH